MSVNYILRERENRYYQKTDQLNGVAQLLMPKDMKKCWETSGVHFACMDKFSDVYENHHKCGSTYA